MTSANKKRLIALSTVVVAVGALSFVALGGIEDNLVYYWDAGELLGKGAKAKSASVRLGGVVKNGSINWDEKALTLDFQVGIAPEIGDPSVRVHATGAPPQMFREGMGVVVEGRYDGQRFNAERVLVKHSNEYRPPEHGEKPSDATLVD
ncbi:MAG: cytochrome c maturation protein CcmE [Clostridia bacterium]|nr:cytochrome c maturation protein CcmE [Deltaproteobacteria bacterium]